MQACKSRLRLELQRKGKAFCTQSPRSDDLVSLRHRKFEQRSQGGMWAVAVCSPWRPSLRQKRAFSSGQGGREKAQRGHRKHRHHLQSGPFEPSMTTCHTNSFGVRLPFLRRALVQRARRPLHGVSLCAQARNDWSLWRLGPARTRPLPPSALPVRDSREASAAIRRPRVVGAYFFVFFLLSAEGRSSTRTLPCFTPSPPTHALRTDGIHNLPMRSLIFHCFDRRSYAALPPLASVS